MHLYIAATGDGNTTEFVPGVDYRGKSGYVVVAPSTVDGRRYEWWDLIPEEKK
jgi:hypothetical protein